MRHPTRIITAFSLTLLAVVSLGAIAFENQPSGYAAYEVKLEVSRNGIHMGAPESTLNAGESSRVELGSGAGPGALTVQQRVSRFPGAEKSMALLELEFFGIADGQPKRLVAPTLGVELGQPEVYQVKTEQGVLLVRATVEGRGPVAGDAGGGPQGIAYPSG